MITYVMFCHIFLPAKRVHFATCKLLENTRLPASLRPTTRECVHLITRGNFRSCEKRWRSHNIGPAISENTMQQANLMALCFIHLSYGIFMRYENEATHHSANEENGENFNSVPEIEEFFARIGRFSGSANSNMLSKISREPRDKISRRRLLRLLNEMNE